MSVSLDPIAGADQKRDTFWNNILENFIGIYNQEAEDHDQEVVSCRTWQALEQRFKKMIQPNIKKYLAIISSFLYP